MSILAGIPVLNKVFGCVESIIDKKVVDKNEAAKIKAEIEKELKEKAEDVVMNEVNAKAKIIVAEAQGGLLARSCRPALMYVFILIIFNNYLIFPYLHGIWPEHIKILELPPNMWNLLTIGIGGYIGARTLEKKWKMDNGNGNKNDKIKGK